MLSISGDLQLEQEKQITTPHVDVGLNPFVTHAKSLGTSTLDANTYYATAKINNSFLHIATGISNTIYVNTYGLSDLYSLGLTATPMTNSVGVTFERQGWGFALSLGDSSVYLHYIAGAATYGASNLWQRTEYTADGASTVGISTLALINNPVTVPLASDNAQVPFINVIDDTLWATTHSRDNIAGGSYRYDVYYNNKAGNAWGAFTKLDSAALHYRSNATNNQARAAYLNVHNTGKYTSLMNIGLSTTPSIHTFDKVKYEISRKEILGRQMGGNIYSLDLQNFVNKNAVGITLYNYTMTETSGLSRSFISVDLPQRDIASQPVFSRTWGFRDDEVVTIRRNTGASINGSAFNAHTIYYRGLSFIIDINLRGLTPSINGTSAAITNYIGVTSFDVVNYSNSNNSNFDLTVTNVY